MNDKFDIISEDNFLPDRNPFSVTNVLSMISAIAQKHYPNRILTTLLPRPSIYTWDIIKALLPEKRIWIIHKRGEKWDEDKAKFFIQMGDDVLRIPCQRYSNGKIIRELLSKNEISSIREFVPVEIFYILEDYR